MKNTAQWFSAKTGTLLLFSILALISIAFPLTCLGAANVSAFDPAKLDMTGPEVSTDIAALFLRGKTILDRVEILDLDILQRDDGKRLVPLLRILRALEAKGNIKGNRVKFSIEPGVTISLDTKQQLVYQDGKITPLITQVGISDVTGKKEIYVHDRIFHDVLHLDGKWDENKYAYQIKTTKNLRIFNKRNLAYRISLNNIKKMAYHLPETEPPGLPVTSRKFISFVDSGIRIDNQDMQSQRRTIVTPDIWVYGQMIGGNYSLRLNENIRSNNSRSYTPASFIKKGLWVSKGDHLAIRAGDTSQGLSGLVVPSASFSGVVARGIFGVRNKKTTNYFLSNSQFSFLSESNYNGYAVLGSTVEFYVNNRLVDTQTVDDTLGAPPGQGRYNFIGVGLMGRTSNDIKIIIHQPNGTVREIQKTVAGSPNLLSAGQLAFSAGAGTKRRTLNGQMETYGRFGGLGVYYGLTNNLTLGLNVADQSHFFNDINSVTAHMPERYYVGQSASLRLFNNIIINSDFATNYISTTASRPKARDLSANYWFSRGLLSLYDFNYDEGYSHGNLYLGGRAGRALFNRLHLFANFQLDTTLATIKNSDSTKNQNYLISKISGPFMLPRTIFYFRLDSLDKKTVNIDDALKTAHTSHFRESMYSFNLKSNPYRRINLSGSYTWGNQLNPASQQGQLWYGINVPMIGSTLSYGLHLQSSFAVPYHSSLYFTYYNNMTGVENVEASISHMSHRKYRPGVALRNRYVFGQNYNNTRLDFEFPLDNRRRNLIGGSVTYSELTQQYSFNIYISMRQLFFQDRGEFQAVKPDWRIQPRVGGIQGMVYLDTNANGHYEPGEPGVPNIEVMLGGRKKEVTSKDGYFLFGRNTNEDEAVVTLNEKDLPAIYTPTQGLQRAKWDEYVFTRVNLGVSILSSITGKVAIWKNNKLVRALPGAVVLLRDHSSNNIIKQSITDSDGTYYLGEVKPGDYYIEVDPSTIPPLYQIATKKTDVKVRASLDMEEMDGVDFRIVPKTKEAQINNEKGVAVF